MRLYKVTRYALPGLAAVLCEQIFGKYIAISGAVPMLCFCFCICTAVLEEESCCTAWSAAVLGGVCDVLSGHGIGTYMLTFTLAAMGTYAVHNRLFSSKRLFLFLDMLVMTIFVQTVYYLTHIIEIGSEYRFVQIILPMAVYNAVLTVIMYPLVKRIFKRR